MYKYKVTLKFYRDGIRASLSSESDWIADGDIAWQESNSVVEMFKDMYSQEWLSCNVRISEYSGDCRYLRKTWNTTEHNWGVE